jgi:hypothetical protein
MSSNHFGLVPCQNKRARRQFPLTLGRCELAKWWWQSCACSKTIRITRKPCRRCKVLAQSVKLLSKKLLYITRDGTLHVLTKRNTHLLWYNQKAMVKKSDSTAILLQPGDSIAIGDSPKTPWMEFTVQRIQTAAAVTPENDETNILKRRTTTPTSRKRLYYTFDSSQSSGSVYSNRQQLSFDDHDETPKDAAALTQTVEEEQSQDSLQVRAVTEERPRKRRKKAPTPTRMKPRRLIKAEDKLPAAVRVRASSTRTNPNDARKQASASQQRRRDSFAEESSSSDNLDDWFMKGDSKVAASPRKQVETQVDGPVRNVVTKEATSKSQEESSSRRAEPPLTGQSAESSILSMPLCPTWDDDEDDEEESGSYSSQRRSSLPSRLFQSTMQLQDSLETTNSSEQEDNSPAIQFASAVPLSEWKRFQQDGNGGMVRRALAGLVVAQRARVDGNTTWLPSLLEGAVVDEPEST